MKNRAYRLATGFAVASLALVGSAAAEDLVFMLQGMGIDTGVDLDKLVEAGEIAQELIGRKLSGKYLQAALGEREKKRANQRAQT